MLILILSVLGLLTQALAQTTTAPAAATTLSAAATSAAATSIAGDCSDNTDLISCFPQSITICLQTATSDISIGLACACNHAQTVIRCYERYCPSYLSELSAQSSALCDGVGPTSPPSSISTGVVTTTLSSETASGTIVGATSKAAAERGTGQMVPALGGLLGALSGVFAVFL